MTILGLLARYTPVMRPLAVAPRDFQVELVPTLPLAAPPGDARRPGAAPETATPVAPRTPKTAAHRTAIQTTTPYPLPARGGPARTSQPPSAPLRPTPPPAPPARIRLPGAELSGSTAELPGWAAGLQEPGAASEGEGESPGAGVRGALRTSVGCDDPEYYNLSKAELAKCHHDLGVQAAIGSKQYVDAINSAKVRNAYDRAREACERLNHYATPLDSDREHSAKAPGNWGLDKLKC